MILKSRYLSMYLAFLISLFCLQSANAQPVLIMDMDNKTVIFEEHSNKLWYPASITKIMTAYLIFKTIEADNGISLKDKVVISKEAALVPYTKPALKFSQQISYETLIKMMLTRSSNGAAHALAEASGGDVKSFVEVMNKWARHMGLRSTIFANPHGLHDKNQVTTASDMAILTLKVLEEFPEYTDYFMVKSIKWGKRTYKNTNELLKEYEGTTGMKTGYICASGFNLVSTFNKGGRNLLAIIFGSPSSKYRFDYTKNLIEYVVSNNIYGNIGLDSFRGFKFNNSAIDMTSVLCNSKIKVAKYVEQKDILGWGILFGSHKTKNKAKAKLGIEIAKIRGIIENALISVVRSKKSKKHIAVLAGLDFNQAVAICRHLNKSGKDCQPLSPTELISSFR